ncbi:replication initiation protein [Sporomusa acidovorans]|uniref:replication initiation protein n=1 Tax=Sporomusa acidovorans TaxID=112900 RepID=UPI00087F3B5F|nr:replication initiation protein [Sporomusa acidovorans]OZC22771.1 initiator replication protein [Sporomusa acidovorans DSM 3132]SDE50515.1 Initiator Replication protein [Sporomusa acidovorans]
MESDENVIEVLCDRRITLIERLTLSQRLLVQRMLLFVKNGHTHKFVYKASFCDFKKMQYKYLAMTGRTYEFQDFCNDLSEMAQKSVEYYNEAGEKVRLTWVMNVKINKYFASIKYNLPKKLSRLYLHFEGKAFILFLLDFMELENRYARRLFHFISLCRNSRITCHKAEDMLKYFGVSKSESIEDFLKEIIQPAIQEITDKSLFSSGI